MTSARVELLDELGCQELDAELVERIHEFNVGATGHGGGRLIGGSIRAEAGELLGGFSGHTWGGVCVIAHLWVAEHLRGTGLGHALLKSAEAEAAKRQCACVILATHSFQAPGFYAAHGYENLGGVEDWPIGHSNIFYRKALASRCDSSSY